MFFPMTYFLHNEVVTGVTKYLNTIYSKNIKTETNEKNEVCIYSAEKWEVGSFDFPRSQSGRVYN